MFERLNPTPFFPAYDGPYKVGSVDAEIPICELQNDTASLQSAVTSTVAFRCYYPCQPDEKTTPDTSPVYWVQQPHQRSMMSAYAKLFGFKATTSNLFSYFAHLMYYIKMPVYSNAPLMSPATRSGKWPVVVFSHGLVGTRNTYSYLCGSLASHGIIVLAPEHRDGSAPVAHVRAITENKPSIIDYIKISHTPSDDVYQGRDKQLRTRLWELNLLFKVIQNMQSGQKMTNMTDEFGNDRDDSKSCDNDFTMFKNKLSIDEPGSISWVGHSFGGATMVQLLKSLYYHPRNPHCLRSPDNRQVSPLLEFEPSDGLLQQITHTSPVSLLDPWALPFSSPASKPLASLPLPCFDSSVNQATSNSPLLAVISLPFLNWKDNWSGIKGTLARPHELSSAPAAHVFYAKESAHLSQSDFGILFPRLTKYLVKAPEPQRLLQLNVRAILQMMRGCGVEVAGSVDNDILSRKKETVRGWVSIDTDSGDDNQVVDEAGHEVRESDSDEVIDEAVVVGKKDEQKEAKQSRSSQNNKIRGAAIKAMRQEEIAAC